MNTPLSPRAIAAAIALASLAGLAHASVVGVSGAMEHVAAPADARLNAYTSPDRIRVWEEQQNHVLQRDLWVDATGPGLYDWYADLGDHSVAAGTMVSSHYVHFDSPGTALTSAQGSARFDARILGVIVRGDAWPTGPARLDDSDYLSIGTLYPDAVPYRGLEFEIDWFSISPDRRTLTVNMRISKPGDYFRVVTEATPAPAPGSVVVLGAAGCLAARRRR